VFAYQAGGPSFGAFQLRLEPAPWGFYVGLEIFVELSPCGGFGSAYRGTFVTPSAFLPSWHWALRGSAVSLVDRRGQTPRRLPFDA
jgi:hypothetical protein